MEEPCGREKDLELETAVESIVEDGEKHQKYHFVLFIKQCLIIQCWILLRSRDRCTGPGDEGQKILKIS